MTTVQEIKKAIEHLSRDRFSEIRNWIADKDWQDWDAQIKADSESGNLDFLLEEAARDKSDGKTKPL